MIFFDFPFRQIAKIPGVGTTIWPPGSMAAKAYLDPSVEQLHHLAGPTPGAVTTILIYVELCWHWWGSKWPQPGFSTNELWWTLVNNTQTVGAHQISCSMNGWCIGSMQTYLSHRYRSADENDTYPAPRIHESQKISSSERWGSAYE